MDNETSNLSSIKARVDALRKTSTAEAEAGQDALSETQQKKKFSVDSSTPIEEGVITMAQTEKPSDEGMDDQEAESDLDHHYNELHPEQAELADNYDETPASGISKKTKIMIAAGVAAVSLLGYGATTMISAVKGKKQETVSLSLQSAKAVSPVLATQPRISSATVPTSPQQAAFAKISSTQKQQPVAVNSAPQAHPASVQVPSLAASMQQAPATKPATKLQAAQVRAVPQVEVQQPQLPVQTATAPQPAPAVEQPKKVEKPKKASAPKKNKHVAKKRIKHDDDYVPQRTNLAQKTGNEDVLAILERARNSQ